ncbi:MAG: type III pantothenate kinase [Bacteroidota bacterium]|nr:type III pantothenate kinase [Bacteroidota bacterium]
MRLIIDIGNTLAKVALFEDSEPLAVTYLQQPTAEALELFLKQSGMARPDEAILSTVRQSDQEFIHYLESHFRFLLLTAGTPIPLKNLYRSPATLGYDRLAAAVAASVFFPYRNVLIVNTGTAITYDLVTRDREYLGGAIAPGLTMRLKALHCFTQKLPMVDLREETPLTGKTTEECILSGVVNAARAEIDGMIEKFNNHYDQLVVILSGGDMKYFDKSLKNSIFAIPNIVISGLNQLLAYNFGKKTH